MQTLYVTIFTKKFIVQLLYFKYTYSTLIIQNSLLAEQRGNSLLQLRLNTVLIQGVLVWTRWIFFNKSRVVRSFITRKDDSYGELLTLQAENEGDEPAELH